jgi:hypothetical protein
LEQGGQALKSERKSGKRKTQLIKAKRKEDKVSFSCTQRGGAEILGMSSLTYRKRRRILRKRKKRIGGMLAKVLTEKEGEGRLVFLLRKE